MKQYLTGSGRIEHPRLGPVSYTVRSSARRVIARWREDMLHVTVPPYCTADDLTEALRQMSGRIEARKPHDSLYAFGRVMDFEDFAVTVIAVPGYGNKVSTHQCNKTRFEIRVGADREIGSPATVKSISNAMRAIARFMAPKIILPRAKEIAGEMRRSPLGWEITSGVRILGRCNSRGVIALSYVLVFLPRHLRDYVICHELAHLSEMNHSAAFHKLCNQYCGGKERELIRELKTVRIPVI